MNKQKVGPNQYVAQLPIGLLFFSYKTAVAAQINGELFRTEKHHSVTTSGHINEWLDGQAAEIRPQAFFDNLAAGRPAAFDGPSDSECTTWVGGIVILLQQPSDGKVITRMVEDEEGFVNALSEEVEGFKGIDVDPIYFNGTYVADATSITLVNGIIPITFEIPGEETTDLNAYAERKAQECRIVWERFAV